MDKRYGSGPVCSAHLRLHLPYLWAREEDGHRERACSSGCLPSFRLQNEAHASTSSGTRAEPSLCFEVAMIFWKSHFPSSVVNLSRIL